MPSHTAALLRIGLAQVAVRQRDLRVNCDAYVSWIAEARRHQCDLLVFPELSDTGYALEDIPELARPWPEYAPISTLARQARTERLAVAAGLCELTPTGIYDSLVLIDRTGHLAACYRKIHLFAPLGETRCFLPGVEPVVATLNGFRLGLMICSDIRFPELARTLTIMGADIAVVAAAWPCPRVSHWETLLRARAIENQMFVAAANRVGADSGLVFCGHSTVIGPDGGTMTVGSEDREALLVCEVARDAVSDARSHLPGVNDRRPDAYRLETVSK